MDLNLFNFTSVETINLSPKAQRRNYRLCFVPYCKNTTITTPDKQFLCVPKDEERRRAWFAAAGCPEKKRKGIFYCCEDHFDLKEDLENYMEYSMTGCRKRLKLGVVPRFFYNYCSDPLAINSEECLQSHIKNESSEDFEEKPDYLYRYNIKVE